MPGKVTPEAVEFVRENVVFPFASLAVPFSADVVCFVHKLTSFPARCIFWKNLDL